MTALLDAIARVFVAPAPADKRVERVAAVTAPSAAVCGPIAEPLACALALLLRPRGPVVVCAWGAAARRSAAPATAGARRAAASMAARGLAVQAGGRLAVVTLDATPSIAAAETARAAAAAGEAPVVLALCGPRDPAFDQLLELQDVVVVASGDAPEELIRLGVAGLEAPRRRAVAAPALSAAAAWAARAGLWAGPGARRALASAIGALR
jgi:hypothetical protein